MSLMAVGLSISAVSAKASGPALLHPATETCAELQQAVNGECQQYGHAAVVTGWLNWRKVFATPQAALQSFVNHSDFCSTEHPVARVLTVRTLDNQNCEAGYLLSSWVGPNLCS